MIEVLNFNNIHWREPLWLLIALQPVFILVARNLMYKKSLSAFADNNLHRWIIYPIQYSITGKTIVHYIFSKNFAYLLAWLCLAVALAGPRIAVSNFNNEKILGANIMLVVDLSRSMKTADTVPDRIQRAKIEINELLEKARNHRVGITVFSARAHLYVPLTSDHKVLIKYIDMLDQLTLPTLGSNPVDAILLAKKELLQYKGQSTIVLISDGESSSSVKQQDYSQLDGLTQNNIPLYILGVGTEEGDAMLLDNSKWLTLNSQPVISRLQQDNMIKLAKQYNGKYSPVYDDDTEWKSLYSNGIARYNSVTDISGQQSILWRELFIYFLLPAMILFSLALTPYKIRLPKPILTIGILCVLVGTPITDVMAIELLTNNENRAYTSYNKKNFKQAAKYYKNVSGYTGYFGQATSFYKLGDYDKAKSFYTRAILNAETDHQRVSALYNLANSHFRTGDFSAAISTYQDVLIYQPEHAASLYNINISQVLKKNIELRQREKENILTAFRQGSGPRTANVEAGTEVGENTSISIGEGTNKLEQTIPLPELPDLSKSTIEKLLRSGLNNIKLAESSKLTDSVALSDNYSTDAIQAAQQIDILSDSQHLLWKRVFEMEQGFPAPVETPHTIPGVNPW